MTHATQTLSRFDDTNDHQTSKRRQRQRRQRQHDKKVQRNNNAIPEQVTIHDPAVIDDDAANIEKKRTFLFIDATSTAITAIISFLMETLNIRDQTKCSLIAVGFMVKLFCTHNKCGVMDVLDVFVSGYIPGRRYYAWDQIELNVNSQICINSFKNRKDIMTTDDIKLATTTVLNEKTMDILFGKEKYHTNGQCGKNTAFFICEKPVAYAASKIFELNKWDVFFYKHM
jgi:hypothetical protein